MKRHVKISAIEGESIKLKAEFVAPEKTWEFVFYNFFVNGDNLARAMAEFTQSGIIPNHVKGLVPIDEVED